MPCRIEVDWEFRTVARGPIAGGGEQQGTCGSQSTPSTSSKKSSLCYYEAGKRATNALGVGEEGYSVHAGEGRGDIDDGSRTSEWGSSDGERCVVCAHAGCVDSCTSSGKNRDDARSRAHVAREGGEWEEPSAGA